MPKGVYVRTKYHREIISKSKKGIPSKTKGRHIHTAESKKKIGSKSKVFWKSSEYRLKMANRKKRSYSEEYRKKLKDEFIGDNNPKWKNNPGKQAVHDWVKARKPNPGVCQHCGKSDKFIDLANLNHKYKRVLEDYIYLCRKCHHAFDVKNNNKKNRWSNN